MARFDFFLPDYNLIIEYDGEQHFSGWGGDPKKLKYTQEHDQYKEQWCKINNITLIRIPYTEYENITLDMILGGKQKCL